MAIGKELETHQTILATVVVMSQVSKVPIATAGLKVLTPTLAHVA